ncbi:hypothetical protein BKA64DRAFT_360427 [Cadophora sp. MPI-SDFR-AT-0126]|nr:hypothetical protein BKA64DRAFT_360427 [Leotiomycetes sp. MPI-SDFR-AT-0126]
MQLIAAPGLASFWALRGGKICTSTFHSKSTWPWTSPRIVKTVRSARQISSTSTTPSREVFEVQKFDVKCGSAGSITVEVYNPSALTNHSNPLIIHLPPTGAHLRSTHPAIPPYLFTPKTTLASINYRWNIPFPSTTSSSPKLLSNNPSYAHHPFPTPLHDTLAGYTFLLSTLLPRYSPQTSSPTTTNSSHNARQSLYAPIPPLPIQRPILIYGSFLGGTLATSLALTENFTSRSLPTKIIGLITKNAVFDWTGIVSSPPPPPFQNDSTSEFEVNGQERLGRIGPEERWDSHTLHELKKQLFASPASAFDSFASPTLFFRTSGLAVPQTWVTEQDSIDSPTTTSNSTSLSPSEAEDLWPSEEENLSPGSISPNSPSSSSSKKEGETVPSSNPQKPTTTTPTETDLARRISHLSITPPSRPAHLKFPPSSSPNLKIPFSLLMYTPSQSQSLSHASRTKSSPKTKSKTQPKPTSSSTSPPNNKANTKSTPTPPPNPATQAQQLATLLRRSVYTHEFSERKIWDEDLDPEAASQARCRVVALLNSSSSSSSSDSGSEDEEAEAVGTWLDELLA